MSSEPSTRSSTTAPPTASQSLSLLDLKKQHQTNMAVLRNNAYKAHVKLVNSSSNAAVVAARDSNAALAEVFQNEQQLEAQIKELAAQTEHFRKRMGQWSQHFLKLNQAMKELGDVHNWSQSIHKDIDSTVTILDEVSAKKRRVLGLSNPTE
eukprot:GILI01006687.1.p1 GENE.GILI01006687.1~~GILI01006687.1.p1  ORF type:complete len:152 (-),score=47.63 GILI01006687.1:84-539(-)